MKYYFIYPDVNTFYVPSVHHGLAQLSSVLVSSGNEVSLQHITKEISKKDLWERVDRENPDYIGFTVMSNQLEYVKLWSQWIKEKFDIPIICGGVHATLNPEELLSLNSIDYVCVGEGEKSIVAHNYWSKLNDQIIKSERYPLVDLDSLPFPDYDIFECERILKRNNGVFPIIVSRGCPYDCAYCCNHALRKAQDGLGRYFRYRSVNNTLEMLEYYKNIYFIKHFSFADDIFGINKDWVYEFCEKYPKRIGKSFDCNLRIEMVNADLLKALKSAGCNKVEMGIESGNEKIRSNVLNRHMSNNQIVNAFNIAHAIGLKTRAYNMIGLPFEMEANVVETINLNKQVSPDEVAVFYFYPFKGTKLYDICKEKGMISNRVTTSYITESILDLPLISHNKLQELYNEFYRYVLLKKFGENYLIKMFIRIFKSLTFGNDITIIRNLYIRLKRI